MKKILVTGGAGYIGSHTCVELLESGYDVSVLDDLSNSSKVALDRVEEIAGRPLDAFYHVNLLHREKLEAVFNQNQFDAVIHFAGFKAVGESAEQPLLYYKNNISGTINLCEVMAAHQCKNIVFSSSATVYGKPEKLPIDESASLTATNPYGRTKLYLENMLSDVYASDTSWNVMLLRYFNPVGAHASGRIGEDPAGIPNNLMPYIAQVAVGKRDQLSVYGDDYETNDGTGVRDYIHVVDLAKGHVKALEAIERLSGVRTYNLGTGQGVSVLQMVKAFESASSKRVSFNIVERRLGDVDACYANSARAEKELQWVATKTLVQMCEDTWRWQKNNPDGYSD